jgi:hypothetical protein
MEQIILKEPMKKDRVKGQSYIRIKTGRTNIWNGKSWKCFHNKNWSNCKKCRVNCNHDGCSNLIHSDGNGIGGEAIFCKKHTTEENTVITYTWCECGENHHGNQQIGEIAKSGNGFLLGDLNDAKIFAETNYNCKTEMFNLNELGLVDDNGQSLIIKNNYDEIVKVNDAHFLIIRNLIPNILKKNELGMNDLMKEVTGKYWDTKYFDTRRNIVLNKHARKNNCIAENAQVAEYSKKNGDNSLI